MLHVTSSGHTGTIDGVAVRASQTVIDTSGCYLRSVLSTYTVTVTQQ